MMYSSFWVSRLTSEARTTTVLYSFLKDTLSTVTLKGLFVLVLVLLKGEGPAVAKGGNVVDEAPPSLHAFSLGGAPNGEGSEQSMGELSVLGKRAGTTRGTCLVLLGCEEGCGCGGL